jgi:hypothetical protein
MMEATLLLVSIAQSFRLRIVPEHQVVPVPGFTLRPKYGMRMKLETRVRGLDSTRASAIRAGAPCCFSDVDRH